VSAPGVFQYGTSRSTSCSLTCDCLLCSWFLYFDKARHPVIQIKISRFTFLEKRKSRDFFTHTNQKSRSRKKISRFLGVTSQNFFARLISRFFSRFSFLEIYILSYTAINLEIFSIKKFRDLLSLFFVVLVSQNFWNYEPRC